MQLPAIAKYIVPAALAFASGFLLWQVERERLALDYEVVTSELFPRESGVGRYFVVRLRNAGNKEARDVELSLALESGTIETKQLSEPSLITQLSQSSSELHGRLPLLNPGEIFSVTLTAVGTSGVGPLKVSARAPGVTASPRTDEQVPSYATVSLSIILALVSCIVAFYTFRTGRLSESISKIESLDEVSKSIENLGGEVSRRIETLREVSKRIEKTEESMADQLRRHQKEAENED